MWNHEGAITKIPKWCRFKEALIISFRKYPVLYDMSDWHQTLRNVTETIRHPFDTRVEEMKQNFPNMFGLYAVL